MLFLYNISIYLYTLFIRIASIGNSKAAAWIKGRKGLMELIESSLDKNKRYIWFHFASLGEFEQGRPVLERLKSENSKLPIIITFFSPSGYEVRKNYALADHVFYLPVDTRSNAREFVRMLNPQMAFFTKYEYWFYYFDELYKKKIPLYLISGILRSDQIFFKWYGGLHRKILSKISYYFVQNKTSKTLLNDLGFQNVSVSGDTRFDRVVFNASKAKELKLIRNFTLGKKVFVAGSTWPIDEKLLVRLCISSPEWKFIIAPHEVNSSRIREVAERFPNAVRYSVLNQTTIDSTGDQNTESDVQVLILDTMGILSTVYQYGDVAYIGGGFGLGLHNTLEAAAFGLPVIFGPNYQKFNEAIDLIDHGAAFSIKNQEEFEKCMESLKVEAKRKKSGKAALEYVNQQTGATEAILNFIRQA